MKERLGHIVRSKEGCVSLSCIAFPRISSPSLFCLCRKMVNVSQKLPFNMHNRPTYGRQDRSLSSNATPPRHTSASHTNPSPDSPTTSTFPHMPASRPYADSRDPSPSIQTSRSTSSLHPGDASYLPPEADPDGAARRPILNIRLVRGPGGFTTGGRTRRGRETVSTVRGRRGRFEEERRDGEASPGGGSKGKRVEDGAEEVLEVESPSTPGDASQDDCTVGQSPTTPAALDHRGAFLASQFKIDDVGSISESWGE